MAEELSVPPATRPDRGTDGPGVLDPSSWSPVCPSEALRTARGVAALVRGRAVAVFRAYDDRLYAIGNHDPFNRAEGLSRGLVGTRDGAPFVASTTHRHAFDLRTGRCLDDESVRVASYAVRVEDGTVYVGPRNRVA